MTKSLTSLLLIVFLFGTAPSDLSAAQCCRDYGGYVPAAGRAYENACRSSCISPECAIGLLAVASLATIIALNSSNGKGSGVITHAHHAHSD